MDTFLITLMLTFAIALGGREQLILGQFTDAVGRNGPMLVVGMACAAAAAGAMAYAGWTIAGLLPSRAADMLIAIALVMAGLELFWRVRLKPMKEPTRSYVAIAAVVFVRQMLDGARFVIFAFAAQATYPATSALGGALGGAAAIALGWFAGKDALERFSLRLARAIMGVCLILAGLVIDLNARFAIL